MCSLLLKQYNPSFYDITAEDGTMLSNNVWNLYLSNTLVGIIILFHSFFLRILSGQHSGTAGIACTSQTDGCWFDPLVSQSLPVWSLLVLLVHAWATPGISASFHRLKTCSEG